MKYGEVIVRYFLQGEEYGEEQRIGKISYDNPMEVYPIIPRKGEQLYLDEIMEDEFQEDFDYFIVNSVCYSIGHDKSVIIDVMVTGAYVELYEDDYDEPYQETEYNRYFSREDDEIRYNDYRPKHHRRVFLDEEGYFDC